MEIIEVEVPKNMDLYFIGDTHIPRGKLSKFKAVIQEIRKCKDAKVIGLGDWIEAIKFGDPRYDPEEAADQIKENDGYINMINEQWEKFEDIIRPIAEQDKILGLHQGNHEYQYTKRHSHNGLKEMCKRLSIRYLDYLPTVWRFKYGKTETKAMTLHGIGSGVAEGYEVRQLDKHSRIFDEVDLIAEGHTHKLTVSVTSDRLRITKDNDLKQNIQWRCACGSFLGNYDVGKSSYSERALYKPLPIGYVKARFESAKLINAIAVPV